jgi:predicted secreted protein
MERGFERGGVISMTKGKVVDMFSRKTMDITNQDTAKNEQQASEGTYVGHIHKETADLVRKSETELEARASQIDAMVAQWEQFAMAHFGLIDQVLQILDIDGFDPRIHAVSISEDGHVWVVPRKDEKTPLQ